jgi:hypothetical protein
VRKDIELTARQASFVCKHEIVSERNAFAVNDRITVSLTLFRMN